MKLGELAAKLDCKLEGGEETLEVHGVAGIENAKAGEITFLANPKYARELATTLASAVFVEESAAIQREAGLPPLAALRSKNPYFDFARAIELFSTPPAYLPEIHPTAVIAKISENRRRCTHRPSLLCRRGRGDRPQRGAAQPRDHLPGRADRRRFSGALANRGERALPESATA